MLELANEVVMIVTAELGPSGPSIAYANQAFSWATGYSAAELVGSPTTKLHGPETSPATLEAIRTAFQTGHAITERIIGPSKSGTPYALDVQIAPLTDDSGTITHFAMVGREVTNDKRLGDTRLEIYERVLEFLDQLGLTDRELRPRDMIRSLRTASEALRQDELVCIFAEGQITRTGQLLPFRRGLERIMKGVDVPIIPVNLDGVWGSIFSFERGRFLWPSIADGVVTISSAQLSYLLSGIDWRMPQKTWRPEARDKCGGLTQDRIFGAIPAAKYALFCVVTTPFDPLPTDLASAHAMILAQRALLEQEQSARIMAQSEAKVRALEIERLKLLLAKARR